MLGKLRNEGRDLVVWCVGVVGGVVRCALLDVFGGERRVVVYISCRALSCLQHKSSNTEKSSCENNT